jgi:hypothetical protein
VEGPFPDIDTEPVQTDDGPMGTVEYVLAHESDDTFGRSQMLERLRQHFTRKLENQGDGFFGGYEDLKKHFTESEHADPVAWYLVALFLHRYFNFPEPPNPVNIDFKDAKPLLDSASRCSKVAGQLDKMYFLSDVVKRISGGLVMAYKLRNEHEQALREQAKEAKRLAKLEEYPRLHFTEDDLPDRLKIFATIPTDTEMFYDFGEAADWPGKSPKETDCMFPIKIGRMETVECDISGGTVAFTPTKYLGAGTKAHVFKAIDRDGNELVARVKKGQPDAKTWSIAHKVMKTLFPPRGDMPAQFFSHQNVTDEFKAQITAQIEAMGENPRLFDPSSVIEAMHTMHEASTKERLRSEMTFMGGNGAILPTTFAALPAQGLLVEELCNGYDVGVGVGSRKFYADLDNNKIRNVLAQVSHLYEAAGNIGFCLRDCAPYDWKFSSDVGHLKIVDWNVVAPREYPGNPKRQAERHAWEMGLLLQSITNMLIRVAYASPDPAYQQQVFGWIADLDAMTDFNREDPKAPIKFNMDEAGVKHPTVSDLARYLRNLPTSG